MIDLTACSYELDGRPCGSAPVRWVLADDGAVRLVFSLCRGHDEGLAKGVLREGVRLLINRRMRFSEVSFEEATILSVLTS